MGHPGLRKLNTPEAEEIYRTFLIRDFPADEVKPFAAIEKMMLEDRYDVYAAEENGKAVGYAFIAVMRTDPGQTLALLDYFAVRSECRGRGIGSWFLRELVRDPMPYDYLVIECDAPSSYGRPEAEEVRRRRIRFYTDCGAVLTGVRTRVWNVDYDILVLSKSGKEVSGREAYEMTDRLYHFMLPENWFGKLAFIYMGGNE